MKGGEAGAAFCFSRPRPRGRRKAAKATRAPAAETGRSCWGRSQQDASDSAADAGSRNPVTVSEEKASTVPARTAISTFPPICAILIVYLHFTRSLRKERVKCRYTISIAQIGGNVEMAVRAGTVEAFSSDTVTGLRLPASAALSLASCWLRPQQLLPVSAAGARVAFAAFLRPLGRGLEKQKAAPASPPFICRWQRSAPLQSSPLPQKVRVLSAKAGENGKPFGKFAKERSNCL